MLHFMAQELNDFTVAQYLREKAKRYWDLAEEMEKSSNRISMNCANQPKPPIQQSLTTSPDLNLSTLRTSLLIKGGRIAHLAKRFNVSEEDISKLISQPNSGIIVGGRGYLKLTS